MHIFFHMNEFIYHIIHLVLTRSILSAGQILLPVRQRVTNQRSKESVVKEDLGPRIKSSECWMEQDKLPPSKHPTAGRQRNQVKVWHKLEEGKNSSRRRKKNLASVTWIYLGFETVWREKLTERLPNTFEYFFQNVLLLLGRWFGALDRRVHYLLFGCSVTHSLLVNNITYTHTSISNVISAVWGGKLDTHTHARKHTLYTLSIRRVTFRFFILKCVPILFLFCFLASLSLFFPCLLAS